MKPRLFAFVVWALVAGSVMFWGLRLLVSSQAMPAHAVSVGDSTTAAGDVTRLLGTTPKEVAVTAAAAPVSELSARFKLTGVMSPKLPSNTGQGVALISVDGKPPRAFGVGSRIDGDLRLQAVSLRTASIGSGPGKAPVVLAAYRHARHRHVAVYYGHRRNGFRGLGSSCCERSACSEHDRDRSARYPVQPCCIACQACGHRATAECAAASNNAIEPASYSVMFQPEGRR
jgi:hypothetical protein